jgi:cytochrome c5
MLGMDSAKVAFDPFQPLATQETKGDVTVVADDVIVAPVLANERAAARTLGDQMSPVSCNVCHVVAVLPQHPLAAASILRIGNVKVVKNYTSCAVV